MLSLRRRYVPGMACVVHERRPAPDACDGLESCARLERLFPRQGGLCVLPFLLSTFFMVIVEADALR